MSTRGVGEQMANSEETIRIEQRKRSPYKPLPKKKGVEQQNSPASAVSRKKQE